MSCIRTFLHASLGAVISYSVLKLATLCKISFILGSHTAFFSGTSVAIPLFGAFFGSIGSCGMLMLTSILRVCSGKLFSLHLLAYHIPGFCASLYWNITHKAFRVGLPLLCMIAFIVHPVGNQAFAYSLYWLIPVVLYYIPSRAFYIQALGSTFIAHAVGSVIWLYTMPMMTAAQWLALIPVVAFERLLCAFGMVAVHMLITYGYKGVCLVRELRKLPHAQARNVH